MSKRNVEVKTLHWHYEPPISIFVGHDRQLACLAIIGDSITDSMAAVFNIVAKERGGGSPQSE
jgi:hypothetical protein